MNIFAVFGAFALSFVITSWVNYEKIHNRHHYVWFIVSVLSLIVPLFVTAFGIWPIVAWYTGFAFGIMTIVNLQFPNRNRQVTAR